MNRNSLIDAGDLRPPRFAVRVAAGALWLATVLGPSSAAQLYATDGLNVRWDNALRYSMAFRIAPRNSALTGNINGDDGDRNFAPGLISNRLDLLSVLDVSHGDYGIHVSGSAWYDTVYHARTDNNSPATYNAASVPNTRFPRPTRDLLGQYAELVDAFAFGNFDFDGTAVSVRVGRQNLLWGESLFFDPNSIAAAQSPYDYIKGNSTLADYSKNVYLPVGQADFTLQPNSIISLSFYYQFEWRASRLPAVGSYFSYLDTYGAGAERLLLPGGQYLTRTSDERPPTSGQYGIALHTNFDDLDLGFYALRYHAKYPFLKTSPGAAGAPGSSGTFDLEYQSGIELYGLSFSSYVGDDSLAGEISVRRNMPLTTAPHYVSADAYAKGDVLHGQISSGMRFTGSRLWDSADLSLEAAADYMLDVTQNKAALNPSRDPFNMRIRALFEPKLFEIAPNLTVSLPVSVGYNLTGHSNTSYTLNEGAGDVEAGISAIYQTVWRADITLTNYLGSPGTQPLADRDFVALSLERTF